MVEFSVTPLLGLCISGCLWEEFACLAPRGVCKPGGDGFTSPFGASRLGAALSWCQWLEEQHTLCKRWEPAALTITNTAPCLHGNQQQEPPVVQPERKMRRRRRGHGCHLPQGLGRGKAGLCSPASLDLPGDGGLLQAFSTCAHWCRVTHDSKSKPLSLSHIPWACSL